MIEQQSFERAPCMRSIGRSAVSQRTQALKQSSATGHRSRGEGAADLPQDDERVLRYGKALQTPHPVQPSLCIKGLVFRGEPPKSPG